MVLIVTPASEINKAKKWKWWLWFPRAWCGICEATANCIFMSLFRVPAEYRHTESLIRVHALMEDNSKAPSNTGEMLNLSTPQHSSLGGMFHMLYPPQLLQSLWLMVEKLDLTNNIYQCSVFSHKTVKYLQPDQQTCTNSIITYRKDFSAWVWLMLSERQSLWSLWTWISALHDMHLATFKQKLTFSLKAYIGKYDHEVKMHYASSGVLMGFKVRC